MFCYNVDREKKNQFPTGATVCLWVLPMSVGFRPHPKDVQVR